MALCQGQHVRASGNEGLLVGQADVLSSLDGGACGLQSSTADNACRLTKEEVGQLLKSSAWQQCWRGKVSYLAILLMCDDCSGEADTVLGSGTGESEQAASHGNLAHV